MKRHEWGMIGASAIVAIVGVFALLDSPQAAQTEADCTTVLTPDKSIQSAIDEAVAGAVICLGEGTWTEHVTIEKSLTLLGMSEEASVIEAREEDRPVVQVTSSEEIEVAIENLTVTGASDESGIRVQGSAKATIRGSSASENGFGIWLRGSAQATIQGSTVSENGSHGIRLEHSAQAEIRDSSVSKNEFTGVQVFYSTQVTITNSTISENGFGGTALADSAQAKITDSTFSKNVRLGVIWLEDMTEATISGNTVTENGTGITLNDSSQATIRDNEIRGNDDYGVALEEAPCFDTDETFTGLVEGGTNTFNGNDEGPVCPDELEFLMTEEGGELDRTE